MGNYKSKKKKNIIKELKYKFNTSFNFYCKKKKKT